MARDVMGGVGKGNSDINESDVRFFKVSNDRVTITQTGVYESSHNDLLN